MKLKRSTWMNSTCSGLSAADSLMEVMASIAFCDDRDKM